MKILIYLSLFFISLASFRGKTIYEGKENHIYLTFDDGYSRNNTIKILDILDEYDIPATFFLEGGFMKDNQDVVKRISDEQIVGNHTMLHKDVTKYTNQEFINDINEFEALYKKITNKDLKKYFRPPMGYMNDEKRKILYDRGYTIFMWNARIYDYVHTDDLGKDYVISELLPQVKSGTIILLHTLTDSIPEALPTIITSLKDKYQFSSLEELV